MQSKLQSKFVNFTDIKKFGHDKYLDPCDACTEARRHLGDPLMDAKASLSERKLEWWRLQQELDNQEAVKHHAAEHHSVDKDRRQWDQEAEECPEERLVRQD